MDFNDKRVKSDCDRSAGTGRCDDRDDDPAISGIEKWLLRTGT